MIAQAQTLVLLLAVMAPFAALGTARLTGCIRAVAAQGVLLGVLPLLLNGVTVHSVLLCAGTVAVKGVVLPRFLLWAIREAALRREIEPRLGYVGSLLLGAVAIVVAFVTAQWLPSTEAHPLLMPASLATLMMGFVVMTTRRKALMQVVGYLFVENGVYVFGLSQAARLPFLLELGVLLDVFVAVFVMGIVVFQINREFDSLDAGRLRELTE